MRYHNITKDDMLNGDGLRVVLWVAGCEHHCKDCHNPITWDHAGGIPFDESAKKELFDELNKPYVSGITFSGGDPLSTINRGEVGKLIEEISKKFKNKTIWVYTGYMYDDVKNLACMKCVDVLVDGKFEKDLLDKKLKWKGSSNQRVIDIKKSSGGKICLHCGDY
ncbi:MAG: anaerobic ribonucleoside-triphosphate reductase activating protein [Clostridia bacterium]